MTVTDTIAEFRRRLSRGWTRLLTHWQRRTTVILEITRHCNQRCAYCYRLPASTGPEAAMPAETLRIVLSRLTAHFGRLRLTLSGGEPTLHANLDDLVTQCIAIDPKTTLITNLSTMTPTLALRLRRAGLAQIQCTFISPVPAEHEALCGPGSFMRWAWGLQIARDAGLKIGAILLVTHRTVAQVQRSLEFLLALGLENFMVNRYNAGYPATNSDAPGDGLFLDRADLNRFLEALEEAGRRWHLTIPLGVPIPSCVADFSRYPHLEFSSCPIGRDEGMYWAVGPDGQLRACNHLPTGLGNLVTTPVAEILAAPPWHELGTAIQCAPSVCKDCRSFAVCRGGCRAAALTWGHGLARADPWVERLLGDRDNNTRG